VLNHHVRVAVGGSGPDGRERGGDGVQVRPSGAHGEDGRVRGQPQEVGDHPGPGGELGVFLGYQPDQHLRADHLAEGVEVREDLVVDSGVVGNSVDVAVTSVQTGVDSGLAAPSETAAAADAAVVPVK
jgi:hypothetical protein